MSAYICSEKTHKALAVFAAQRQPGGSFRVSPSYLKGRLQPESDVDVDVASCYADVLYHCSMPWESEHSEDCPVADGWSDGVDNANAEPLPSTPNPLPAAVLNRLMSDEAHIRSTESARNQMNREAAANIRHEEILGTERVRELNGF